jgi:hypothetical protein
VHNLQGIYCPGIGELIVTFRHSIAIRNLDSERTDPAHSAAQGQFLLILAHKLNLNVSTIFYTPNSARTSQSGCQRTADGWA